MDSVAEAHGDGRSTRGPSPGGVSSVVGRLPGAPPAVSPLPGDAPPVVDLAPGGAPRPAGPLPGGIVPAAGPWLDATLHLTVPVRALVVVGGIPGAGKTTLIRRWTGEGCPSLRGHDPEDVRVRWERWLGDRRAYRLWRPLVYLEHYARLGLALAGRRTVLLQDTATRWWVRRALRWAALASRRPVFLVWVDATLAESFAGQRARGRWVRLDSVLRHWRRWSRLRERLHDGGDPTEPGYAGVVMVDRAGAGRLQIHVYPGRAGRPPGSRPAVCATPGAEGK